MVRTRTNYFPISTTEEHAYQAEIDSDCEMIDFWRFNPYYMTQAHAIQPDYSPDGFNNYSECHPTGKQEEVRNSAPLLSLAATGAVGARRRAMQ